MADQPQQDDESFPKDNVSTGAQISTANDVPAILHDGPDGVPQSGHSVSKERLSLSARDMNDQKDKVNDNDNAEARDTSTGAGTGDGSLASPRASTTKK